MVNLCVIYQLTIIIFSVDQNVTRLRPTYHKNKNVKIITGSQGSILLMCIKGSLFMLYVAEHLVQMTLLDTVNVRLVSGAISLILYT